MMHHEGPPPSIITENLRVIRHELETPMRAHDADGSCCLRARMTPLPDEEPKRR